MPHPKKSILRDGATLSIANASGQVVALLLLAIIGRQYDQETMGVLGSFLAWSGIISIVAGGRFEQAIIVAESDQERNGLARLAMRLILALFLLLQLAVIPLALWFSELLPMGSQIVLLPGFVLTSSVFNVFVLYLLSHKEYKRLAYSQAIKGISNNLLKVLFGLISASIYALIAAQSLSLLLPLLLFGGYTYRLYRATQKEALPYRTLARRYHTFPVYGIPQVLIDTLLGSLLILMIPLRYGTAEIGFLTMAIMLAKRPLLLFSDSLSQVYFQRLSAAVRARESIAPMVHHFLAWVFGLGIPLAIVLAWVMPSLVFLVVGDKWEPSAIIITAMLPMLIPNFANATLNILPDIFKQQRINMWAEVILLVISTLTIGIGFGLWEWDSFIPFFFGIEAVSAIGYLLFLYQFVVRYQRSLKRV